MRLIRTLIMSRKVQWSVARCFQCSKLHHACGLPCLVPCRRLPVLVNGRLYHRWLCQTCIQSIWGTISAQTSLPSRLCEQQTPSREQETAVPSISIDHPFKRGQRIGHRLIEQGMIDVLDVTTARERQQEALRYARYAYPDASAEDVRTLAAGILHQWTQHQQWR